MAPGQILFYLKYNAYIIEYLENVDYHFILYIDV